MAHGLEAAGHHVRVWRRELGRFTPADLRRVSRLMDEYALDRRILLQWVPHGYGYRSMNLPFCVWIANRREPLDIMVHEPGLGFGEGGLAHQAVAAVHRAMAAILLRKADRVFIATEAWEQRLRPYAFGRKINFRWLPVPSNIPVIPRDVPETNDFGYFGQYDPGTIDGLLPILNALPGETLLIGRGSERVQHKRASSTGDLTPEELSQAIASCKLMFHLYPDGASGRRGTLMASLAHGKAVVTNRGPHTEPQLAPLAVQDTDIVPRLLRLLTNPSDRRSAAADSRQLYDSRFHLRHTIAALTQCESR